MQDTQGDRLAEGGWLGDRHATRRARLVGGHSLRSGLCDGRRAQRTDARRPAIITNSNFFVLQRPVESALHAPGAVVDQAVVGIWPAGMDGLLQRIQHEVRRGRSADLSTHDPAGKGIDHEGHRDGEHACPLHAPSLSH